jgi:hypothetical protein
MIVAAIGKKEEEKKRRDKENGNGSCRNKRKTKLFTHYFLSTSDVLHIFFVSFSPFSLSSSS